MSQFMTTSRMLSLDHNLRLIYEKMIEHEQKGEYVGAERCRVEWEHRKEELKNKQLHEMELTHKKLRNQLTSQLHKQLNRINQFWANKMNQFHQHSQQSISHMLTKHHDQCLKLQDQLGLQLSTKVKESSELLNLRKMEEQMAKQKNYVEAHRVQQKIKKLYAHEEQLWLEKRTQKINQALLNLRNKQAAELSNLKKRIKTTEEDNLKDQHFEILRVKQRYENTMKDLKAQQERETLSFKGQFKTLGGSSPVGSPNKSKLEPIHV